MRRRAMTLGGIAACCSTVYYAPDIRFGTYVWADVLIDSDGRIGSRGCLTGLMMVRCSLLGDRIR